MVSAHNMPTRHCQHTSLIACGHSHIVNPDFSLLPRASPQRQFIYVEVYNIDTGETQVAHFDHCYCSQDWCFDTPNNILVPRIIDLLD